MSGAQIKTQLAPGDLTTRRSFVVHMMLAGALSAAAPPLRASGLAAAAQVVETAPPACAIPPPVLSFYMDQPYLDPTGRGVPYCPPSGTRSAQPLAALSERDFCCGFYGV